MLEETLQETIKITILIKFAILVVNNIFALPNANANAITANVVAKHDIKVTITPLSSFKT